jgi:hypothetical protein
MRFARGPIPQQPTQYAAFCARVVQYRSTTISHFPLELGVRAGGTACSSYSGFLNGKDET